MELINLYKILQVDEEAEPEVIEAAWRRLARKYHPDTNKNPDATRLMQSINSAYEILSNPYERSLYDRERKRISRNAVEESYKKKHYEEEGSRKEQADIHVKEETRRRQEPKKSGEPVEDKSYEIKRLFMGINPAIYIGIGSISLFCLMVSTIYFSFELFKKLNINTFAGYSSQIPSTVNQDLIRKISSTSSLEQTASLVELTRPTSLPNFTPTLTIRPSSTPTYTDTPLPTPTSTSSLTPTATQSTLVEFGNEYPTEHFAISITGPSIRMKAIIGQYVQEEARGIYLVLPIRWRNTSLIPRYNFIEGPDLCIITGYSSMDCLREDVFATSAFYDTQGLYFNREIKLESGSSTDGWIVFDIPEDMDFPKLRILTSSMENVEIVLP